MKGLMFLPESSGSLPIAVYSGKKDGNRWKFLTFKKIYTWHDELIMFGKVHSIDVFKHKSFMQSQC